MGFPGMKDFKMLQSIPHQIVQSPARLGLPVPTPNSPSLQTAIPTKFSSQTSQMQQIHQTSNQLTIPAVSAALLPLIPPLPRAQSLLLQMASLASKLFEVSPNCSNWLSAFRGSLPTFLSPHLSSLPASLSSSPSSTKEVLEQFTTLQTQLCEAVGELQQILDLQDANEKLAREIRSKDSALLTFANKLKDAEHVLDVLLDDYSNYRRPKRAKLENDEEDSTTTIKTQLNVSDILSYAHKISYTTFAPPEFGAGQAPLRGALPPAPQEEQMRASQLYNFADLEVGLPKTDGADKMLDPLIAPPIAPPSESNPLSSMSAIQGLIPPNIVVPSGWKPGMPVELPVDLPILPPLGWKPGDRVSLPPLDSLPPPQRVDEQLSRPIPPPGLTKVSEPIQVRHVQLDIDDDSSDDYSSDSGSSDSEV